MSSWKDSSDFASLSAALLKAKPQKSREIVDKAKSCNEIEEALTPPLEASVSPVVNYSDFCENDMRVPTKDTFLLKQHKSTVSVLEFESSGSRFLSGSHDTTVAYWDFNGMVRDQAEPFRFIEPMGSYTVK
jgi:WD40 repeat protein